MRRFVLIFVASASALAAGAVPVRPATSAQARPDPAAASETRRALVEARGEAARARERTALLDAQARAALAVGDKATLATAALAARVQQVEAALAAAEADLALVRERRRGLAIRLARANAPVARLLAGLQTQLRQPALLQLVRPGSIADAVRLRAVVVAVEPQIRERTTDLRGQLDQVRVLEREVARMAATRRALQADLVARRNQLATLSAAERLKARRASSAADREAERAFALGHSARDLSTLARRLEADAPRSARQVNPPFSQSFRTPSSGLADRVGPHRLPVQGRRVGTSPEGRRALTLASRPGALVIAPGPGRVAFAGPYRGYGSIVILEHARGWTSLLTGLSATEVAVGQQVVAGSPLGRVAARDPRITIELRRDGVPVDAAAQLR